LAKSSRTTTACAFSDACDDGEFRRRHRAAWRDRVTAMKRVLVIGSGGSGKTTLATQLGARLGIPVIHLDSHYWHSGWVPTPADEWTREVQRLVDEPAWIMDGNYGGTMDMRLAAADTVIFLDLPRVVCLWRIVKRAVRYWGRTRPDLAPGCPETLSWEFVVWVWTYPDRRRPGILKRLRELDRARAIVLSSQNEVDRFVEPLTPGR
jgi:adenylate kinase family enzyme